MLNSQNKFETFEQENKLTALIQKLMEPHIHNFYKNQALLTDLSHQFKAQLNEVSNFKQNLEPKYNELKQKVQILDQRLNDNFKVYIQHSQEKQQQIDLIQNQIQKYTQQAQQTEKFNLETKIELQNVKASNSSFKSSLEQAMDRINQIYSTQMTEIKQQLIYFDQSQRKIIQQISHQDNQQQSESKKIDQIKQDLSKIQVQLKYEVVLDKMNQEHQTQQQEIKIIKNQLQKIDGIQHNMNQIEIYLRYYLQYQIQNQINDSLFFSQPIRLFSKYAIFEKQKLDEFDKTILKIISESNIQELMNQHQIIVLNASKRFQKVQETLKNAENNDQESSNEDQRGDESKQTHVKDSQTQNPSKKKEQANLVYFEEQIRQLKDYCDFHFEQNSIQIESLNQKFKQLIDELYLSQIQFQANIEQNFEKQQLTSKLSINDLQQTLNNVHDEFQKSDFKKFNEELIQIKKFQQNLIKLNSNLLCLLKQDEMDKEDIKLLGAKDVQIDTALQIKNIQGNQGNKKSSILINSDCLSCSGSPIQLFQFFKVACLSYNPSDIEIDGRYFKRIELIQQCQDLIKGRNNKKIDLCPVKQRHIRQIDKRSNSIQVSPRFFSTENKQKLQKFNQMKIFE